MTAGRDLEFYYVELRSGDKTLCAWEKFQIHVTGDGRRGTIRLMNVNGQENLWDLPIRGDILVLIQGGIGRIHLKDVKPGQQTAGETDWFGIFENHEMYGSAAKAWNQQGR